MSDEPDRTPPPDPFLAEDPEAYERERRRLQREAKRKQRSGRKSLSSRVSGALDGAADKGREAIEQTRDRVARHQGEEAPSGAEPPPLRRSKSDPGRVSADVLMPRRPGRERAAQPESEGAPASQMPRQAPDGGDTDTGGASPSRDPQAGDEDWFADADGAPPPEVPPERTAVATGDYPPLPPPSSPPPGTHRGTIIRVVVAGAIVLVLGVVAYALLSDRSDAPAPATNGPRTLKTADLTIPEGYTRSQIAEVAADAGLKGDYEKETASPPKGFDIAKEGAPGDATLEGFLFPSTYNLEKGAGVNELIDQQLVAFNDNVAEVDLAGAKKKNLTLYDVVIIASMIEREVLVPEERPVVAAVIYNRLSQGIPLGIDATLRYDLDNFDKPLTESDLATESPYNTRLVQGLPPTPIANPGLDSLKAAANPSNDDYLYYVGKYGTCGEHFFTSDYDEFLAASDEYNQALETEGGSPTEC